MRHLIITIGFIALVGCGKSETKSDSSAPCDGLASVGMWHRFQLNDVLVLDNSCHGSSSYCDATLTFTRPDSNGLSVINVTKSNAKAGCMAVGMYTCNANVSTVNSQRLLKINCPTQSLTFTE